MAVARRSPVRSVLSAVVNALKNSSGVTALATGGVYNDVPQGSAYPYVMVSSPTDRPEDTYGAFGASVLVDVKAVSQEFGDSQPSQIVDQCIRALNFQAPSLSDGYRTLGLTWENSERYSEIVAGVITRHHVASFRIWAEQTTS